MPPANEAPALDCTLLIAPRATVGLARRGMTFIELLVVLVLMALSAAVVFPAISNARVAPDSFALESTSIQSESLRSDKALDPIFTAARKLAINRAESIRLRVASDGIYAMVSLENGAPLTSGRVEGELAWLPDVIVDALGTSTMARPAAAPPGANKWDALACRWRRERAR